MYYNSHKITIFLALSLSFVANDHIPFLKKYLFTTYYQVEPGIYTSSISGGTCIPSTVNPCTITYIISPQVQTFMFDNQPSGIRVYSPEQGLYE